MAGFDFDQFNAQLSEQAALIQQRQQEELVVQDDIARAERENISVMDSYNREADGVRRNLATTKAKIDHSRSLMDSGNPLDQLRLMGLQMLDPAGYTVEGRNRRMNEDSNYLQSAGQVAGIQQQAIEARLKTSDNKLNKLKTLEAIGNERLTRSVEEAKLLSDNITAHDTMQLGAIHDMDVNGIRSAVSAAEANGGSVNLNGIDLNVNILKGRLNELEERDYQLQVRRVALLQNDETLARKSQQRELQTMNPVELQGLRESGYKNKAGEVYNPDDVEQAYTRANTVQADRVQQTLTEQELGRFDIKSVTDESAAVDELMKRLPVGGIGSKVAQEYRQDLAIAANFVGPDKDMPTRIVGYQLMQRSKEKFVKAIDAQAEADSRGRQDAPKLKAMMIEHYSGRLIPLELTQDIVSSRLLKNSSLGDVLPADTARTVEAKYRELVQAGLKQSGADLLNGKMTADERKMFMEQAATEALQFGISQSMNARSSDIIAGQVLHPSHPLYGKVSPQRMQGILQNAIGTASQLWKQELGLSDQEAIQLRNGIPVPNKPEPAEAKRIFSELENQQTLIQLEQMSPGLGTEVALWWQEHGMEYVDQMQGAATQTDSKDFRNSTQRGISNEIERSALAGYGNAMFSSDQQVRGRIAEDRSNMLFFNKDPRNTQAMLLQMDENLEDGERTLLYTKVIQPLMQTAASQGISDYRDMNLFVEKNLAAMPVEDEPTQRALRKVLRDRSKVSSRLEQMQEDALWFNGPRYARDSRVNWLMKRMDRGGWFGNEGPDTSRLKWFQNILASDPAQTNPNAR